MVYLFSILTALSNAVAVATQHVASTSATQKTSNWRLFLYLARQPLWLIGWVAMAGSLVFQSLALHFGPMSIVQPLLVSELVIALALRRVWLHQSIRLAAWSVAALTGLSLIVFLVATSPTGGAYQPTTSVWTAPSVVCLVGVGVLVVLAQRGSPHRRAALFACATAIAWAIEATFIKATTDVMASIGVMGMFARWPVYALVIAGVIGLFCEQAALHVGPLSVSQPFIVIIDPVVSVALGIWIYREQIQSGPWHVIFGSLAFIAMGIGVVLLTRLAPPSMSRDVHRL
jgi:hypothetical protein